MVNNIEKYCLHTTKYCRKWGCSSNVALWDSINLSYSLLN